MDANSFETATIDPVSIQLGHYVTSDVSYLFNTTYTTRYLPFNQLFRTGEPSIASRWTKQDVRCPHCNRSFAVQVVEWPALFVAPIDYPVLLQYADAKTLLATINGFFSGGMILTVAVGILLGGASFFSGMSDQDVLMNVGLFAAGAGVATALITFIWCRTWSRISIRRKVPLFLLPLRSETWKNIVREFKGSKLTRVIVEIAADEALDKEHFMWTDGQSCVYVRGWDELRRHQGLEKRFAVFGSGEPPHALVHQGGSVRAD